VPAGRQNEVMPEDAATAGCERSAAGVPDLLVVDAANVVGSRPDGWWRDRAGAARRLVDAVTETAGSLAGAVVVVLEGAARAGVPASEDGRVGVVHASGSGDDEITRLVAAAADSGDYRRVVVVTSDRGLRERVERHGASTEGPRSLWRRLPSR
jgi:predicted RNA-binding protein with PIN domain